MPPVFGPVSCSPTRLKSCAGARATACSPSLIANSETSSPSSSSSIRRSPPSAAAARRPASSSSWVLADEDALAGREPVDLDHAGRSRDGEALRRSARRRPRARPSQSPSSPSIRAAARVGPNTATPPRRSVSASPTTSGASGPTTTRSIAELAAEREQSLAVLRAHRVALPEGGDAGVAGRGVQLVELRARGELPGERVLAAARPDDQHLHGGGVYCRRRRRPVRLAGYKVRPASSPRRSYRRPAHVSVTGPSRMCDERRIRSGA